MKSFVRERRPMEETARGLEKSLLDLVDIKVGALALFCTSFECACFDWRMGAPESSYDSMDTESGNFERGTSVRLHVPSIS